MRFQLSEIVLQLDELIAAIGSPIGAATEDQQQAVGTHQIVQRTAMPGLIRKREFRDLLTNRRTSAEAIVLGLDELNPFIGLDASAAGFHFANDAVQNLGLCSSFHS